MTEEIEAHVLKKYEILQKLGKFLVTTADLKAPPDALQSLLSRLIETPKV